MKTLAIAILLSAPFSASAECISGETLVHQDHETRQAIGIDQVHYASTMTEIRLSHAPDYSDTQMYLFVDAGAFGATVVPTDWCYDTSMQAARFTTPTPRMIATFSNSPVPIPEGTPIWVAYHSSALDDPNCRPGIFLNYLPGNEQGSTFGEQYFAFDPQVSKINLIKKPRPGHQMYLYGSGMWVYGLDWCYDERANQVRLLREVPRLYTAGGIPGSTLGDGQIVWIGYVPQ